MIKRITVLGGGPGGYTAAIRGAQQGAQVTIIEHTSFGGTCLNWGCIPTKAYVESVHQGEKDLKTIKERKRGIVEQLVGGVKMLLEKNKVEIINGRGRVISPREVEVELADGSKKIVENDTLILATGSKTFNLPLPGMDSSRVLDSKDILDLEKVPESLAVIGGGVIGMELAQIFAQLGTKVTVIEMLPKILANLDEELVRRIQPVLKKEGIEILTGTKVTGIKETESGLEVSVSGKKDAVISAEYVLAAAGRVPNLDGIDFESLGLEMERRFIKVDNMLKTNLPDVYAIGDLTSSPMLAHVASYEGEVAVQAIFGSKKGANYEAVPACVYTHPELAGVGITENQAKEKGLEYKVGKFPFTANGRALTQGANYGMVKIIGDANTGKILGAHILGPSASELIHELTLAVRWGLTVEQVAETIHAHPTLAEAILEASHGVFGKPVHAL
ncbi:MAG: dihydrolipoyl dehydrogenase [Peptococcales bacterium]|jgi:dihydrolipoamide dehydrogenase